MKQLLILPTETIQIEMPNGIYDSIQPCGIPNGREFKIGYSKDLKLAQIIIELSSSELADIIKIEGVELVKTEII